MLWGMVKCKECEGCGCPACLGVGKNVKKIVKTWGDDNGFPGLTPEKVPDLTVEERRLLKQWIEDSLDGEASKAARKEKPVPLAKAKKKLGL